VRLCGEVSIDPFILILQILTNPSSLSIKIPLEQLEEDLTALISPFGRCHVKVKMASNEKTLPVGFVQFEVSDRRFHICLEIA
jgi:hypothetical protein